MVHISVLRRFNTIVLSGIFGVRNSSYGKIMFLHLSVILFMGGHAWQGVACMVGGGVHGRGCAW